MFAFAYDYLYFTATRVYTIKVRKVAKNNLQNTHFVVYASADLVYSSLNETQIHGDKP